MASARLDFEDGSRGDIARTVSDQEPDYAGNLLRARHAPQRYGRIQPGELGWVVHRADVKSVSPPHPPGPLPGGGGHQRKSCDGHAVRQGMETALPGPRHTLLPVPTHDEAEIVVHEADDPNAVVDLLDAEAPTGEHG